MLVELLPFFKLFIHRIFVLLLLIIILWHLSLFIFYLNIGLLNWAIKSALDWTNKLNHQLQELYTNYPVLFLPSLVDLMFVLFDELKLVINKYNVWGWKQWFYFVRLLSASMDSRLDMLDSMLHLLNLGLNDHKSIIEMIRFLRSFKCINLLCSHFCST